MIHFNKENDELLINLIRSNPILYDGSEKNYKNIALKHRVWEDISETLKIPVPDVKKRWKHFRDHYIRKKKAATVTGQVRSETTWEYMSQLTFLSQAPSRIGLTDRFEETLTQVNEQQNENSSQSESTSQENVSLDIDGNLDISHVKEEVNNTPLNTEDSFAVPAIKRRKKTNETSLVSVLKNRQEEIARVFDKLLTEPHKSSTHKFFESMADIVCEFPPHLVAEARLKVCELVNEIERKKDCEQNASSSLHTPAADGGRRSGRRRVSTHR